MAPALAMTSFPLTISMDWDAGSKGHLRRLALRQGLFRLRPQQVVDEPPARLGMRAACDQDRAVRDEQCPHAVCVRIDDADRLAFESRDVRVIGICNPHS